MKTAATILAFALVTLTVNAQRSPAPSPEAVKISSEPPPPPAKLSPEVSEKLSATFKYAPPAPEKEKPAVETPAAPTDPDMLQLPKVTVTPRKRPRLNDAAMMTTKGFNEMLAKEKTSSFDRNFLNKYNLLGGASAAERAREEYNREQRAQMANEVFGLAKVVEVNDPEQAKQLREAVSRP